MTEQQRFEEWADQCEWLDISPFPDNNDSPLTRFIYQDPHTRIAWKAWQAALEAVDADALAARIARSAA